MPFPTLAILKSPLDSGQETLHAFQIPRPMSERPTPAPPPPPFPMHSEFQNVKLPFIVSCLCD